MLSRELPILGLAAGFVALFVATTLGMPKEARIFPYTVMAVLAGLGVAVFLIELRQRKPTEPVPEGAGLIAAASLGFMGLFWMAGFQVASLVFLFVTMWRLKVRPVPAGLIAVGTTAALHLLFRTLLGVPL